MMKKFFNRSALRVLSFVIAAMLSAAMPLCAYAANSDGAFNDSIGGSAGGGPIVNNNSPSANGGGAIDTSPPTADTAADTVAETGEVLGVMDTGGSAVVGIIIAILIAIAVIVLILALIPRESAG